MVNKQVVNRRAFVGLATGMVAGTGLHQLVRAGEPPRVKSPRATDGDKRFEPNWDEKLTLTVGQKKGDLVGQDDKVIQAAVDYLSLIHI